LAEVWNFHITSLLSAGNSLSTGIALILIATVQVFPESSRHHQYHDIISTSRELLKIRPFLLLVFLPFVVFVLKLFYFYCRLRCKYFRAVY
uniref:PHTF2 factor n=1 Tax=Brugia timori TaxID=42155 RepID=A0A0R3R5S9_9BILA